MPQFLIIEHWERFQTEAIDRFKNYTKIDNLGKLSISKSPNFNIAEF